MEKKILSFEEAKLNRQHAMDIALDADEDADEVWAKAGASAFWAKLINEGM